MKKLYQWAGYLLAAVIILLVIIILNRESLAYYGLRKAVQFYAARANLTIDIGRISGDLFSRTTIASLTLRPEPGQAQLFSFKTGPVSCTYNFRDLSDGFNGFLQGLDCKAEDPQFLYDLRVAAPEEPAGEPAILAMPAMLPGLEVRNGAVTLLHPDWQLEITNSNGSLHTAAAGHELLLEVGRLRFSSGGATRIDTALTSKLRYAEEKLFIDSLAIGEQDISASGFIGLGRFADGYTEFGAELVFADSRLRLSGALDRQLLKVQAGTEHFDLAELRKRLGGSGWDLAGLLQGQADITANLEAVADTTGDFSLFLRQDRLFGVALEEVSLAGTFDRAVLSIITAEAKTPGNHILISDLSMPLPLLLAGDVLPIIGATEAGFRVDITDFAPFQHLIQVEQILPEDVRPRALAMIGSLGNGILHLDEAAVMTTAGSLTVQQAVIPLPAVPPSATVSQDVLSVEQAEISTPGNHILVNNAAVPMALLRQREPLAILAAAVAEFRAEIGDPAAFLQFVRIEKDLLPANMRPASAAFRGSLKRGELFLAEATARTAAASLEIEAATITIPASADAAADVPIDLTARFRSDNLLELTQMYGDLPLSGEAAAAIVLTGSMKEPLAVVNLTGDNLAFGERRLGGLRLRTEIRLIQEAPGSIASAQFVVTELTQTNQQGTLALLTPASGSWRPDAFAMEAVLQTDGQGTVAISFSREPGQHLSVAITTDKVDSSGWLESYIGRRFFFRGADIEAHFTGSGQNPQLRLAGTVNQAGGTGMDFPLTGSFDLTYSSRGITISEFTWQSRQRNRLTVSGFLPYDPLGPEPFPAGELSLKGRIDFPALDDVAGLFEPWWTSGGSLVMDIDVSGSWQQPVGRILFRGEGLAPPAAMRQYMEPPLNLAFDMTARGGTIVLQSATLQSPQYTAQASGSWQHGFSVRDLMQKRGMQLQGDVSADATVQVGNLNFLRKELPWLRRLEGDLRGEIHVEGPITAPALNGSFALENGEASHIFNFPTLAAVYAQGEFTENSITITNLQAELGGSPVTLRGDINREQETIGVNLQVNGGNILLFRSNDMQFRGNVELQISGPLEHLAIKGTTGLTGGYYTKNIDFLGMIGTSAAPVSQGENLLFSFQEPPLKNAVFDISISTIEPFRVRNNLVRGTLRPELRLKGTGELPYLVGTVYIDPARLILPSGRLQIQSGLLRFLEGEPDRPQLELVAQSRVLGYDINVLTRGPMDEPVITLTSNPPLPNDEILLLLLTGQPPKQDVAGGVKSRSTTNVMVYLGRDFLTKWLEDETGAADETILDRFELDFGRNITKSGEQTIESTFRLSEYKSGTGVTYYLTGEKDRYDAYNYGLKMVFRLE